MQIAAIQMAEMLARKSFQLKMLYRAISEPGPQTRRNDYKRKSRNRQN